MPAASRPMRGRSTRVLTLASLQGPDTKTCAPGTGRLKSTMKIFDLAIACTVSKPRPSEAAGRRRILIDGLHDVPTTPQHLLKTVRPLPTHSAAHEMWIQDAFVLGPMSGARAPWLESREEAPLSQKLVVLAVFIQLATSPNAPTTSAETAPSRFENSR